MARERPAIASVLQLRSTRGWIELRRLIVQVIWFGSVGACSTASYTLVMFCCKIWLALNPVVANAIAYPCGMVISYFGHRKLTFQASAPHRSAMPKFLLQAAIGYGYSSGVLAAAHALQLNYYWTVLFVSCTLPLINFLNLRLWVFAKN